MSEASLKWRWDQGRLIYFQFENIKPIAYSLCLLNGVEINQKEKDPLRHPLEKTTGLPFSPNHYRVWRNYKRVFECAFLATNLDGRLFVTDFCKRIGNTENNNIDSDEYLSLFIPRFRFPFIAFSEQQHFKNLTYPFCAILKLLITRFKNGKNPAISLEEVFSYIIGNNCTGFEEEKFYIDLKPTNYQGSGDENRQVREMLVFISQLSILKWFNKTLFLDITLKDFADHDEFRNLTTPHLIVKASSKEEDFIRMTSLKDEIIIPLNLNSREIATDDLFIEGKRTRVNHVKIERSPLLRKLFFKKFPETICNMCVCDTRKRYPWTDNILEVHHILPLSSTLTVTSDGTSLTDVVGLCPNCHKSVHSYYKNWLNQKKLEDFRSKDEAKEIYYKAKTSLVL